MIGSREKLGMNGRTVSVGPKNLARELARELKVVSQTHNGQEWRRMCVESNTLPKIIPRVFGFIQLGEGVSNNSSSSHFLPLLASKI